MDTNVRWGFCPNCGTEIFVWDEIEQVGEVIYQYYDCPNCGKRYAETFVYTRTDAVEEGGAQ